MRNGFTLVELLIAAAIGMGIVFVATQQLYEFFNLQSLLLTRTELREETQVAQEKISQRLRYAIMLETPPDGGYMIVVPKDVDRCGRLCYLDTYDIYWWRVKKDPLLGKTTSLIEQHLSMPAFKDEPDTNVLEQMFGTVVATSHEIAKSVDNLSVTVEQGHLYRTVIGSSRTLTRRPEPVKIALTELVAPRSLPMAMESMPTFKEVLEKMKKHEAPSP